MTTILVINNKWWHFMDAAFFFKKQALLSFGSGCNECEVQVHVRSSFTAGKDSLGRFPSLQDHGVNALMLHRSYWKRTGGQKRQREPRMKEEEIGARLTLVCYSWTVYKIWVADVRCCFLSQTQRLRSEPSFASRWLPLGRPSTFLDIFDEDCRKQFFFWLCFQNSLNFVFL